MCTDLVPYSRVVHSTLLHGKSDPCTGDCATLQYWREHRANLLTRKRVDAYEGNLSALMQTSARPRHFTDYDGTPEPSTVPVPDWWYDATEGAPSRCTVLVRDDSGDLKAVRDTSVTIADFPGYRVWSVERQARTLYRMPRHVFRDVPWPVRSTTVYEPTDDGCLQFPVYPEGICAIATHLTARRRSLESLMANSDGPLGITAHGYIGLPFDADHSLSLSFTHTDGGRTQNDITRLCRTSDDTVYPVTVYAATCDVETHEYTRGDMIDTYLPRQDGKGVKLSESPSAVRKRRQRGQEDREYVRIIPEDRTRRGDAQATSSDNRKVAQSMM